MPALSQASRVTIEETTGSGRSIELLGRALPYQRVAWAETQRVKTIWYPGNPTATIQVLGPQHEPTVLSGTWKDRFLPGQVNASGFASITNPQTVTAAQVVEAFESLLRSGNRLRVQWADVVREGVLTKFTPTWIRPQDVEWEVEFTWSTAVAPQPRAASAPPDPRAELRTSLDAVDSTTYARPQQGGQSQGLRDQIRATTNAVRTQVGQCFDAIRQAETQISTATSVAASVQLASVAAISSSADSIRLSTNALVPQLVDRPYTTAMISDSVVDVLRFDGWRRSLGSAETGTAAVALRVARQQAETLVPGAVTAVQVPGDMTLRQLAITYSGNADAWQTIADANGLVGSIVRAGTLIAIPPVGSRV